MKFGYHYRYEIRAEVIRKGQRIRETKTVQLQAGQTEKLTFETLKEPAALVTTLILHVPEGATVTLAGHPLPAGKKVRTYQTTQLSQGETWKDYPIQVIYQENGEPKQLQRMVTLKAGNTHKINLRVESGQIANLP